MQRYEEPNQDVRILGKVRSRYNAPRLSALLAAVPRRVPFGADLAVERLLAGVNTDVPHQIGRLAERLVTHLAAVLQLRVRRVLRLSTLEEDGTQVTRRRPSLQRNGNPMQWDGHKAC